MKKLTPYVLFLFCIFSLFNISAQPENNVEVIKLSDKFYKLVCANGSHNANTFAFVGDEGILLVDAGYAHTSEELQSKIKTLGNGDLKTLINTHVHTDHVGANALFAKDDIKIIAHDNVSTRLKGFYGQISNIPAEAIPNQTFTESLSLSFNGEKIEALYYPGHSDGDIIIHFPDSKIVCMGDMLLSPGFPSVEVNVGGDIERYLESMEKIIDRYPEDTKFFAGHGDILNHNQMKEYYQMAINTTDAIRKGLKEGKDIITMRNEEILKEWKGELEGTATANYWIGAVATSLTHSNTKTSIAEPILNTIVNVGVKESIRQYRELKKDNYLDYEFDEGALNLIGYNLLVLDRIDEAIEIFKLNVEEYPESFNVYDSLGESYMVKGENKLAIENYKKSLELNANNINATEMIKRMKAN